MDQVRAMLGWLKRQHFWVLTVLVALIAFVCWWSAAGKLSAKYDANQKTIAAGFNEIQTVRNTAFHPNETINTQQTKENEKQLDSVKKVWQQLYDKQREHVLQWPKDLSQAFRDAVEKMQFNDEIPEDLRDNYQNYIERHFPELPKQIGARPLDLNAPSGVGGGEYGRGPMPYGGEGGMAGIPGMMPEDDDYVCEWLDQQVIRDELNFPQRPSSLRIWVTQEDLWVYHTLLNVIAKTNQAAGATRMSNAAVKVVMSLEVGQRAAVYSRSPGRLLVPPMVATAAAGMGDVPVAEGAATPGAGGMERGGPGPGGPMGMGMGMDRYGGGTGGAMTPAQEQGALLSFRYLDDKGQPIPIGGGGMGAEGGAPAEAADPAMAAGPAPPLDLAQFGTGYKRLPVRMVMQMDSRWLPQLITACANEPLRVEVQEVRVNPTDAAAAGGGGGYSMMGMGGGYGGGYGGGERGPGSRGPGSGMGGMGAMGGPAAGANLFPDRSGIQTFPMQPHVATIVVQGTIYIFKKPDLNILQPAGEQPVAAAN